MDGTNGYCLPLPVRPDPNQAPLTQVIGSFALSESSVALTNVDFTRTIRITNNSPATQEFRIKRLDHFEPGGADGGLLVTGEDGGFPLNWVTLAAPGATTQGAELVVLVPGQRPDGGNEAQLTIGNAQMTSLTRWQGRVEVTNPTLGRETINLSYHTRPDGRWAGTVYYFANFPDENLDQWIANPSQSSQSPVVVGNALVVGWEAFRNGRTPLEGPVTSEVWSAMLSSVLNSSWNWSSTREDCRRLLGATLAQSPSALDSKYCYLVQSGLRTLTDNPPVISIPRGVAELPIALDLQESSANTLSGRIATSESLHYAGDPSLTLSLAPPAASSACTFVRNGECITPISGLNSEIAVGARLVLDSADAGCPSGFKKVQVPWLLAGFSRGVDSSGASPVRHECRDQALPFPGVTNDVLAQNESLAQSNPIPDGRSRRRRIELVDGALVNQTTIYILFRERFLEAEIFGQPGAPVGMSAYGVMVLRRAQADITKPVSFTSNTQTDSRNLTSRLAGAKCGGALLDTILGSSGNALSAANVAQVTDGVLEGSTISGALPVPSGQWVHYLCGDTGLFNGGAGSGSVGVTRVPCPIGSAVSYFTMPLNDDQVAQLPCQTNGTCAATLDLWRVNASSGLKENPPWKCSTQNQVFCDQDRTDLRLNKTFYAVTAGSPAFLPLQNAVNEAFRYKTRFKNRQGTTLAFTPELCLENSNQIPYCYSPKQIEQTEARIDCLVEIARNRLTDLDSGRRTKVLTALLNTVYSGGVDTTVPPGTNGAFEGFEDLNAQLLVMLGDESYTRAFASRFDLAGSSTRAFRGSLFEPGGLDLAGGAGNEMYSLYQASQYYQRVLDRFYTNASDFWFLATQLQPSSRPITLITITNYLKTVIRSSTQRTRAASEIAKRYQTFNRADLARRVVERAYTSAYLESLLIARLMDGLTGQVTLAPGLSLGSARAQIRYELEQQARNYRAALLDMRTVYRSLSDEVNYFGYAPDFIPFPALQPGDVNAFQKLLAQARQSAAVGTQQENLALQSSRSYETDSAQFQAELVKVRTNYENQLGDICGTFTGRDGNIYPAIPAYAEMSDRTKAVGNPCGLVGNGSLHATYGRGEIAGLELQRIQQSYDNILAEVDLRKANADAQCGNALRTADFKYRTQGGILDAQQIISTSRAVQQTINDALELAGEIASLSKCNVILSSECLNAGIAAAGLTIFSVGQFAAKAVAGAVIADQESRIAQLQLAQLRYEGTSQCQQIQTSLSLELGQLMLRLSGKDLDVLKANYELRLLSGEIERLQNQAKRLSAELEEQTQLLINVAAAQNNPNVRIYKNDAVISADRTFEQAIRDAYLSTKAFEYYTSQSYAPRENLFLIRMVSHGTYDLDTYLQQLQNEYATFQQQYGNPDTRVAVLSLRDDVLAIPRVDSTGRAANQATRIDALRTILTNGTRLDKDGYLTFAFETDFALVSPLTRNHKVLSVEAEVIGSDVGDGVGRVYLRQRGTGTVAELGSPDRLFYRLPERTAVVNAFFNGVKVFAPEVYKSDRLRDRPLVNSRWEVVLNQKDENANKDINLRSLTDIRLYVYYSDFTQ